jgi:hypothetical protein
VLVFPCVALVMHLNSAKRNGHLCNKGLFQNPCSPVKSILLALPDRHFCDVVRLLGRPEEYSSQFFEASHSQLKEAYRGTSKKKSGNSYLQEMVSVEASTYHNRLAPDTQQ